MADDKHGGEYFNKPQIQTTKWQSFKAFLWNSDTKEFLGRTGLSWLKITVFYIIFYSCLAAFWTVMLIIFYQTLSSTEPRWTLSSSRIGANPGLGFRPRPPEANIDSTLIWFDASKNETVQHWVNNLDEFLKPYQSQTVLINSCTKGQGANDGGSCYVDPDPSNGQCSSNNYYGYADSHPCVIIKLNRIYGWKPEPFVNKSFPSGVPEKFDQKYSEDAVYISCEGENAADKDNLGVVEYFPPNGIPRVNFPFTNQKEYLSPFVFAKFTQIKKSVLVNIECKAWAKNIHHERADRLGMVHFEILAD